MYLINNFNKFVKYKFSIRVIGGMYLYVLYIIVIEILYLKKNEITLQKKINILIYVLQRKHHEKRNDHHLSRIHRALYKSYKPLSLCVYLLYKTEGCRFRI